ncbi:Protein of unknown function [Pyronema omphalodes CBS 100304]|uniref:Uncharacterized protein n=1 Tax=Pyronema omphalodes (strain CBS 100304) TaxID=1076935 RepID=U4LJH9_PYROM|nr:Protein of unknown function [Pyronema omphalodes CBS 100304]
MEPSISAPTSTPTTGNTLAKFTTNTDRTRESTQTSGACDEVDPGIGIVQPDIGDSPISTAKGHLLDIDIVKTKRPPPESETQALRQAKMIKSEPSEEVESSPVLPSSEATESFNNNHPHPAYLPANTEEIAYSSWSTIYGRLTQDNNNLVWFNCNISDKCNWSDPRRWSVFNHLKTNHGLERNNYELHCLEILRLYGTTKLTGDAHANQTNSWTCGRCRCVIPIRAIKRKPKDQDVVTLVTGLTRATEHLYEEHQIVIGIRDIFPDGCST